MVQSSQYIGALLVLVLLQPQNLIFQRIDSGFQSVIGSFFRKRLRADGAIQNEAVQNWACNHWGIIAVLCD